MKKIGLMGSTQIHQLLPVLRKKYEVKIISDFEQQDSLVKKTLAFLKEIKEIDILYNIYTDAKFYRVAFLARLFRKKVVSHWIGTDVLEFYTDPLSYKGLSFINVHLVCSKTLQNELLEKGRQADYLPIPPFGLSFVLDDPPKEHAVLLYMPEGRENFYGLPIVREVFKKYPNVPFYIVANENKKKFPEKNVHVLGRLSYNEMDNLYKKISIVLRVPQHDGLSMSVIEALAKGKEVIYNNEHPYAFLATDIDSIAEALDQILSFPPTANIQAHTYVKETYTEKKFLDRFQEYVENKKE